MGTLQLCRPAAPAIDQLPALPACPACLPSAQAELDEDERVARELQEQKEKGVKNAKRPSKRPDRQAPEPRCSQGCLLQRCTPGVCGPPDSLAHNPGRANRHPNKRRILRFLPPGRRVAESRMMKAGQHLRHPRKPAGYYPGWDIASRCLPGAGWGACGAVGFGSALPSTCKALASGWASECPLLRRPRRVPVLPPPAGPTPAPSSPASASTASPWPASTTCSRARRATARRR